MSVRLDLRPLAEAATARLAGWAVWHAGALGGAGLSLGSQMRVQSVTWWPRPPAEGRRRGRHGRPGPADVSCPLVQPLALSEDEGRPLPWSITEEDGERRLSLQWPQASRHGFVGIRYEAVPDGSLAWDAARQWVHTAWSCESWVPCITTPGLRQRWQLSLVLPQGWQSVQTPGEMPASPWRPEPLGRTLGVPGYLMGFAAGPMQVVRQQTAEGAWLAVAPADTPLAELEGVAAHWSSWVQRLSERAGMPWPHASFTGVHMPGYAGQELNAMMMLSRKDARQLAAGTSAPWMTIHELAHQWWGNGVTNATWQDMWLNEGLATYMTQDAIRQAWGDEQADIHLGQSLTRWQALVASGRDRPLHFDQWRHPSREDRQVVYDKGAWFFETLRALMGDEAFHQGLRDHTRRHWGRSVTPQDLQQVMQEYTQVPLQPMFDAWVWGRAAAPIPPERLPPRATP